MTHTAPKIPSFFDFWMNKDGKPYDTVSAQDIRHGIWRAVHPTSDVFSFLEKLESNMVNDVIREFAIAHTEAEDNPRLLLLDYSANEPLCAERMKRCKKADEALFALVGNPSLPQQAKDYLAAENDSACSSCRLSSKRVVDHPECEAKMKRWWETRTALIAYGLTLDIANKWPTIAMECGG